MEMVITEVQVILEMESRGYRFLCFLQRGDDSQWDVAFLFKRDSKIFLLEDGRGSKEIS